MLKGEDQVRVPHPLCSLTGVSVFVSRLVLGGSYRYMCFSFLDLISAVFFLFFAFFLLESAFQYQYHSRMIHFALFPQVSHLRR